MDGMRAQSRTHFRHGTGMVGLRKQSGIVHHTRQPAGRRLQAYNYGTAHRTNLLALRGKADHGAYRRSLHDMMSPPSTLIV